MAERINQWPRGFATAFRRSRSANGAAIREQVATELASLHPSVKSWYCDQCHVEVYERRCPHCGKTKRETR